MKATEQQIHELIESREDFVVVLNKKGIIVHSNQNWIDYCYMHQQSDHYWKVGGNYFKALAAEEKIQELQYLKEILSGKANEHIQLTSINHADAIEPFSIKYRKFLLDNGKSGAIVYKQPLTQQNLNMVDTKTILESMTDAFYLLDEQMNFYHLNSKTEALLQIKQEELIGQCIWDAFPRLVGTAFFENYTRAMQEKIPLEFEEYYAPLNSWYAVRVKPVQWGGLAVYYREISRSRIEEIENEGFEYTDYLTGWSHRIKFEERVDNLIKENLSFSLIYINLDNFKHINTLFSHKVGNEIIQNIARKLEALLGCQETAGRLEGDELILLHLHKEEEIVDDFPNQVKEVFRQPFVLEGSQPITVEASMGISSFPKDSVHVKELLAFAETAMREAKKHVGSAYSIFHPSMKTDLARRIMIEESLEGDLSTLGVHFAVQPQINCITGELNGIEVLARWNHPKLGLISPLEFINIAEETGTISSMTLYLLKEVFSFINKYKTDRVAFPKTAINIAPSLLTSKVFFEHFFLLMEEYQISPDWIEIEITESEELTYSEVTLENLIDCRSKGISIALDDFGTGFSMLAYLMDFPIDKIKLDKSFITKIGYGEKAEAVLKSLIQFVKGIDCELVAEGVEEENEAAFLKNSGCTIHQGYLYDRPLLPELFVQYYLQKMGVNDLKTG